jgi:hypothetical protein
VGEFVEVFNDSQTDPAAWLGKVHSVGHEHYVVRPLEMPMRSVDLRTATCVACWAEQCGAVIAVRHNHYQQHACTLQVLQEHAGSMNTSHFEHAQVSYPFHDTKNERIKVCTQARVFLVHYQCCGIALLTVQRNHSLLLPPALIAHAVAQQHDCVRLILQTHRLRRARLFERETRQWKIIKPDQTWEDGEARPATLVNTMLSLHLLATKCHP